MTSSLYTLETPMSTVGIERERERERERESGSGSAESNIGTDYAHIHVARYIGPLF